MRNIIQKRKIWLSFSGILVAVSIVFLSLWGLKFGIDFTGGALLEVKFNTERPNVNEVRQAVSDLQLGSLVVQPVDEKGMLFRFQNTDEDIHQQVLDRLAVLINAEKDISATSSPEATSTTPIISLEGGDNAIEQLRYDSVGPSIGQELKRKSVYAILIVLICIVAYIAWAFRKVSKPVASWKFGLASVFALFHDVIIVLGIFAFLGKFYNIEINTAFVAAILTVLGYSVNDTIVVFDRIRENLPKSDLDFEGTVNQSVNQTITRSINTSFTTLLVLVSILIFGGQTIKDFILALSIGVLIGTYSSIFVASPILVIWEKMKK